MSTRKAKAHRCHNCQHLIAAAGRAYCGKRHRIAYEFPETATVSDYGYRADVGSCGKDFTKRDSSYYAKARSPRARRGK